MNAPQLIRALGTPARLAGLATRQAELVALEDRATLDDVLDLLDDLAVAVDAARPVVAGEEPRASRRVERILELAEAGLRDPEIAAQLGVSVPAVRSARRRAGIPGQPTTPKPSGWQDRIREAHGRGLLTPEIAAETGYSVRTVQQYLARLGLRAHRRKAVTAP